MITDNEKSKLQLIIQKLTDVSFWILLSVIIVFGIFFRTHCYLNSGVFFWDECALVQISKDCSVFQLFLPLPLEQCCPPVFLILTKIIYSFFGMNEIALRSIVYLSAILSIFLFTFLECKIFKNKLSVLIGTVLFITNANIIDYSVIFKHYCFDILATILILIFIVLNKEKLLQKDKKMLIKAGIYSSFLFFMSYTSAILIFTFTLLYFLYFINNEKNIKNLLRDCKYFLIPYCSILMLFFLAYFIPLYQKQFLINFWNNTTSANWGIYFFPHNLNEIKMFILYTVGHYANTKIFVLLIIVSLYYLFKNNKFVFVILTTPIVTAFILGFCKIYPMAAERVSLYIVPIFILLFTYSIENISKKNKILSFIIILFWINCMDFVLARCCLVKQYEDKREFANSKYYLEKLKNTDIKPNEYIFSQSENYLTIYDDENIIDYNRLITNLEENSIKTLDDLKKGTIIYFYINERYSSHYKMTYEWIKNNCNKIFEEYDIHGNFTKCEKRK